MIKITVMGAGSTVFTKRLTGDVMLTPSLRDAEIALYDIDPVRLEESYAIVSALNENINENRCAVKKYCGVENRKDALRGATFVINVIQVGFYKPCTVTDFEVPKKYGLRQTIADTLGIGGIFRGLRTIPVMRDFARDMEEVCPDAYFLNYTNPMAILSGYMQRYTGIKTIGLCHSVQVCTKQLLRDVGLTDAVKHPVREKIAGINHMAWLLEIEDADGKDLYPQIREKANEILKNPPDGLYDLVRLEYIRRFGYFVTESSEHNAEYNMFFIKNKYPELIDKYRIPLDEYPRRCVKQEESWKKQYKSLSVGKITHEKSREYASFIMNSLVTNEPFEIAGNVLNTGLITNLPKNACVEVPCLVNKTGILPTYVGDLPEICAAMNRTNVNVQLLTIEAAVTEKKEAIYRAAMLDPHTSSELSIDEIISLCDDLIEAHGDWLPKYR